MAITYGFDPGSGIILEYWSGVITAADVEAHWTTLANDPRVLASGRTVADARECDIRFSGEDVRRLASAILEPAFRGGHLKAAILVSDPVQYGVARQYRAWATPFSEATIFTDPALAREWLLSSVEAAAASPSR